VVEDGTGAVDDFLIALNLRHDLLLHLQRRQGDLVSFVDVGSIEAGNPRATAQLGKVQCFSIQNRKLMFESAGFVCLT